MPAFLAQNDAVLIASDVPDENRMALMKACYALKRTVLVSPRVQEIMLSSANQVILDDAPLLEMRADGMTLGRKSSSVGRILCCRRWRCWCLAR